MSNRLDFEKYIVSRNDNFYNLLLKIHDLNFYKNHLNIDLKKDKKDILISKLLETNNDFQNDLLVNISDYIEEFCTSIYSIKWEYNQHLPYDYKSNFYVFK